MAPEVDAFRCPNCLGAGTVRLYADRPSPCEACGGSGEVVFRYVEREPGHMVVEDVGPQPDLWREEAPM